MPTLFRWVPSQYAEKAKDAGNLLAHNGGALWVFDINKSYRPGETITHGAVLIAYDLDDHAWINITTRDHQDFEKGGWLGETKHPRQIIVKSNEPGAYGIGWMRSANTFPHLKAVRYATLDETGKAIGLSATEIKMQRTDTKAKIHKYKPTGGWTH